MNGLYVAFNTDLFRNDIPDDEIDQWFLGEDLAEWLHDGLTRQASVISTCAPIEEDGGWTFGVRASNTRFWINIWNMRTWIVGLEPKPGLLGALRRERTGQDRARFLQAQFCIFPLPHGPLTHG